MEILMRFMSWTLTVKTQPISPNTRQEDEVASWSPGQLAVFPKTVRLLTLWGEIKTTQED